MLSNLSIILASSSPRRKELLQSIGLQFTTIPSDFDESSISTNTPSDLVEQLSFRKAQTVYEQMSRNTERHDDLLVIGADTVVVLNDEVLGKPSSKAHAEVMLERLQGKTHSVYTGLCLLGHLGSNTLEPVAIQQVSHEKTDVTMAPLSSDFIRRYVATNEPMDKAGSYAIQGLGATMISRVEGDYFTVVGLPLHRLTRMLSDIGIQLF